MKNEVSVFENSEFGKLTAIDMDGEPWFVGNEVASILGYADPKRSIRTHCKYAKILKGGDSVLLTSSPRGIKVINEKDVYRLIMRSNLPAAEKFQDWVMDEVLPAIRKTGTYNIPDITPVEKVTGMPGLTTELEAGIKMANLFGLTGNQALLAANTAVKNFHNVDCLQKLGAQGLIAEDKKQYFTATVLGKRIGLSAQKFNKILQSEGLLQENRDHKNRLIWEVTETGKQYSQLLDTSKEHSDGTPILQIKWCSDILETFSSLAA